MSRGLIMDARAIKRDNNGRLLSFGTVESYNEDEVTNESTFHDYELIARNQNIVTLGSNGRFPIYQQENLIFQRLRELGTKLGVADGDIIWEELLATPGASISEDIDNDLLNVDLTTNVNVLEGSAFALLQANVLYISGSLLCTPVAPGDFSFQVNITYPFVNFDFPNAAFLTGFSTTGRFLAGISTNADNIFVRGNASAAATYSYKILAFTDEPT